MKSSITLGLFFILVFAGQLQAQDKIKWMTITEMEIAMSKEPRKVLIDVYTSWCGPCKMMMSQTFTNPEIISYINEHYYAVKFNAEGNESISFRGVNYTNSAYNPAHANRRNGTHDFTKAIAPVKGKIAYPTLVYLDEKLEIIAPVQGFWKSDQYIPLLHFIQDEIYLSPTPFDTYLKEFQK